LANQYAAKGMGYKMNLGHLLLAAGGQTATYGFLGKQLNLVATRWIGDVHCKKSRTVQLPFKFSHRVGDAGQAMKQHYTLFVARQAIPTQG
jgi:hypothetical protein